MSAFAFYDVNTGETHAVRDLELAIDFILDHETPWTFRYWLAMRDGAIFQAD